MNESQQKRKSIKPELVCPAGTPAALRAAVDAGADAVYCGFRNETNARNFPGLNFSVSELEKGIDYAHSKGAKVLVALNTFPHAGKAEIWQNSAKNAANAGADAIIVADLGLAAFVADKLPSTRLHLSVQASTSSSEAINYYMREFGVKRVVLPRLFSIEDIKYINSHTECETEVFVFGGLCVMAEGRCSLSHYATGKSPNVDGVCSPASHVRYDQSQEGKMSSYLGEHLINTISKDETAAYPTICKGRYLMSNKDSPCYTFGEPASLNASELIPEFIEAGVSALKIEGRQRSKSYVHDVVSSFRDLIDKSHENNEQAKRKLLSLSEGIQGTSGAYNKNWR